MYKVFFNDSFIQFGGDLKKSLKNNELRIFEGESYGFVNQFIDESERPGASVGFVLKHQDETAAWEYFKQQFYKLPAAGGLVKNQSGHFLFIRRFGYWDLPKGKIEVGETPEIAAVREVEEECGLSGVRIIKPLPATYHIYRSPFLKSGNNLVLKETSWFLMDYDGDEAPVPQISEDIVEVRWVAPSELKTISEGTYKSLRELIEQVVQEN